MELEDSNLPLITELAMTTSVETAFRGADVIILNEFVPTSESAGVELFLAQCKAIDVAATPNTQVRIDSDRCTHQCLEYN